MHPAQTVSWQMDSKDVGRDSVLYKPPCSLTSFFTTAFIILQENRMGCTCGRHLFFIETVSCTFSWLLPFHTGFKGWQSIARGLVQWGYNGDGHCPEWTQVWKGPLKQQPNKQPACLTPFWVSAFQSQGTKSVWAPASRKSSGWSISSSWSSGIGQRQGRQWTGRPTSKEAWGLLGDRT